MRLGPLEPFVQLGDRIDAATILSADERAWLHNYVIGLRHRYENELPAGRAHRVSHGAPWAGNVVALDDGRAVFLDLERFSIAHPNGT